MRRTSGATRFAWFVRREEEGGESCELRVEIVRMNVDGRRCGRGGMIRRYGAGGLASGFRLAFFRGAVRQVKVLSETEGGALHGPGGALPVQSHQ
jgi:hypothetical protein